MTTKEKIAIMQLNGPFQTRPVSLDGTEHDWVDCLSPEWDWVHYEYRTRPENRLEMFADFLLHNVEITNKGLGRGGMSEWRAYSEVFNNFMGCFGDELDIWKKRRLKKKGDV